jgi:DNA uptake protein ComE-like DNA-binding protein
VIENKYKIKNYLIKERKKIMKTNNKITKKDNYITLLEIVEKFNPVDEYDVDAIKEFINKEIDILDRKAASAKKAAAKKKAEPDKLYDLIHEVLSEDEFEPIAVIVDKVNELGEDIEATPQKAAYRLNKLVEANIAEKTELTIPGGEGQKKRKVQGYKLYIAD